MLTNTPVAGPAKSNGSNTTPPAQMTSVTFVNSAGRKSTMFATGDQVRVEVEFIVHKPVEDVVIEVYFYSIFHNLHSHFSTVSEEVKLNLEMGRGTVEFFCPELPFEPGSFFVEASIRRRESDFTEHLDYMHATSIHVTKGKPVNGVFHTFHTWSLKTDVHPDEVTDRINEL
jgi:hypothetical protein